ncbi:hypothetical protein GCM10020331_087340 [Ectobacillus funiculus]
MWEARMIETENEIGVEFFYMSPDGEGGYPGNLDMKVTYTLNNHNEFLISYNGVCDQKNIVECHKSHILQSKRGYRARYIGS